MSYRYLGLDLSLTGTGAIIIDEKEKISTEVLIKSKKISEKPVDELIRLKNIVKEVEDTILNGEKIIKLAAIEGIAFGVGKTTHLAQLSALNYMIRDLLYDMDIPFVIIAPKSLKKYITGSGNASKDDMMFETLNKYEKSFHNDNLCDAFALSLVARDIGMGKATDKYQQDTVKKLSKQL
jgi:crossover junction endodeoxyribonuclease RuvC